MGIKRIKGTWYRKTVTGWVPKKSLKEAIHG